jgi:hypothetical protein
LLEIVANLALEYGWTKQQILEQVLPEEVGPLLDAAYRRRASLNLDRLSIACAPYATQAGRDRLFEFWNRVAHPRKKEEATFDPAELLRKDMGGLGVSPELRKKLEEREQGQRTDPSRELE